VNDEALMRLAIDEAVLALDHDDVPIGCIVARAGEILAAAHNERERRSDPTAHAEVLALRAAAAAVGSWRLEGATVCVTIEPCAMCAGALVLARAARLVYGAPDPRAGAALSLYNIVQDPRLNHSLEVITDVRAEECTALLEQFFGAQRGRRSYTRPVRGGVPKRP
jgi:tRNA(adenine34) deaminase